MGSVLEQCCNDAWDIIRGRKKIVRNTIIDITEKETEYTEKTESEYGWLLPDGRFYNVEFGNHQAWASEYLLRLYRENKITYEEAKIEANQNAGDVLVNMGWILIHNPSNMLIKVTRNESKTITKSQKEFLYDFYIKHEDNEKANELYR